MYFITERETVSSDLTILQVYYEAQAILSRAIRERFSTASYYKPSSMTRVVKCQQVR